MVSNLIPWRKKKNEIEVMRPRYDDPTYELTRGMSDMMDHFFRQFDSAFGIMPSWTRGGTGLGRLPSVDIAETNDEVTVTADLPGLDEKDIQVSLDGDILTLRGERKHEKEEKRKNYHRVERSYGSFVRSVALPEGIDRDNVKATFKKGVLQVSIAKLPGAKSASRHIPVQAG